MRAHEREHTRRRRARAAVAIAAAGALALAGAGLGVRLEAPGPEPEAAWWVVDRDAGALVALGPDLLERWRQEVAWPVLVRESARHAAWVVSVPGGWEGATRRLLRFEGRGPPSLELALERVIDLEVDGRGSAFVVGRDSLGAPLLLVVGRSGVEQRLVAPAGCLRLAVHADGSLALAAGAGGLHVRSSQAGLLEMARDLPVRVVVDVAAAPGAGWWILADPLPTNLATLLRLDERLQVEWARACPSGSLARTREDQELVWLLGREGRSLHAFGAEGGTRVQGALLEAAGEEALVDADGGVVVVTAGALLRLDPRGRPRPGQGGFERLTGVAAREGRPAERSRLQGAGSGAAGAAGLLR